MSKDDAREAPLGLAWLGLAWLSLAWLGLAWLGLAWLGMAWAMAMAMAMSMAMAMAMARLGSTSRKASRRSVKYTEPRARRFAELKIASFNREETLSGHYVETLSCIPFDICYELMIKFRRRTTEAVPKLFPFPVNIF
ncbi:hypothetical protein HZH68_004660 [Vespula germanica]|uniref:Uncharacterized protein n=1 Tax=Vespula germanica TaxID=30212 RepID=A0A834KS82_VESGE|nr:hypothetical protein HZH68_004660 [Vespula germanica]